MADSSSSSSPCNKSFSSDYLLLKPEKATMVDMLTILFSSNISNRKFVDCPDGKQAPFRHRWAIFVSVTVMRMLHGVADILARLGKAIEYWLNLVSVNGGFFKLIYNFLKGKVVFPVDGSASFLSFIGHMDKRVALYSKMKYGDKGYYVAFCVMAAKIAYENINFVLDAVKNHWKMDFVGFYNFWNDYQGKLNTQAFVTVDKNDRIIVTFRGTEPFNAEDWATDFDISWYEIPGLGKIHSGFMKALGMQKNQGWPVNQIPGKPPTAYYTIRTLLKLLLLKNKNAKIIITGHSLGGALAALFPAILVLHKEESLLSRLEAVYTYGQPRVGDPKFGESMKAAMKKYGFQHYRIVYGFDMVPRVPPDIPVLTFKHFGTCVYYNSFYKGKVVAEVPNKNYLSIIWIIPMLLNALWELIRGYIIPFTRGPEYKETGLMRIIRVAGLLLPGVSNHCPPDYVNSTRLGSPVVFTSMDSHEDSKSELPLLCDEMV